MKISQLKSNIEQIISSNSLLRKSIVAIYGIGSVAKGKKNYNDIDINIFINNNNFVIIKTIAKFQKDLSIKTGKDIDLNIVDQTSLSNNIINSDIFPHKNRHALFLYELTQVKCLLYGDDILKSFIVHYSDLITESFNLVLTLAYRLNKEFLTKKNKKTVIQALKYARYACEFALIFRGIQNPYIKMDAKSFLMHYPELRVHNVIVNHLWKNNREYNKNTIAECYNFIVDLGKELKYRYFYLLNNRNDNKNIVVSSFPERSNSLFVFPSQKELNLFFDTYDKLPTYKKVQS